jgi:hypothetical protein
MRETINIKRTVGGSIDQRTSLEEVGFKLLLKGTSTLGRTFGKQTVNVSALFTKVISHVPSVANVFSDCEDYLGNLL